MLESQVREGNSLITLDVRAMIISEREFVVNFIVLLRDAEVQGIGQGTSTSDALFGAKDRMDIKASDELILLKDTLKTPLRAILIDDFRPEGMEFFEIGIVIPDSGRENFDCREDTEIPSPDSFFCKHTVYIIDDDGQLIIV